MLFRNVYVETRLYIGWLFSLMFTYNDKRFLSFINNSSSRFVLPSSIKLILLKLLNRFLISMKNPSFNLFCLYTLSLINAQSSCYILESSITLRWLFRHYLIFFWLILYFLIWLFCVSSHLEKRLLKFIAWRDR